MGSSNLGPIRCVINATQNSLHGLRQVWGTEASFRYEIYVLIVALPTAWFLAGGAVERALMIGSASMVVVVELINSAIETVVDRIGPEHHPLSGRAKDLGSAAVFCSIVLALMVWLIVLLG